MAFGRMGVFCETDASGLPVSFACCFQMRCRQPLKFKASSALSQLWLRWRAALNCVVFRMADDLSWALPPIIPPVAPPNYQFPLAGFADKRGFYAAGEM